MKTLCPNFKNIPLSDRPEEEIGKSLPVLKF